jgi:hypothetical protein
MARQTSNRKAVAAIEASGGKFFETAVNEEAKRDPRRDGSYRHPFVNLASVDPRHVSVRLEKAGARKGGELGVGLGRVSEVDRVIMRILEKGVTPMTAAAVIREASHESKYVRRRLKLMLARGLLEFSELRYCLRGGGGAPKTLFDGGSRYTEAPGDVPERGIFKGDMLELSAAVLRVGDLVMASRDIPSRQERLAKVVTVWPKFVVLDGGEMRMKVDVFKVTSVFRPYGEQAELHAIDLRGRIAR